MRQKIEEAAAKAFREGASPGGRREITIIQEGWGSSGYYSGEVLSRDIPEIFPVGTKMYLNHPTEAEEQERPERDLHDLVGTLATTPRMAGICSVAEANIYDHWKPTIDAMANDIGLSIRAWGFSNPGSAGGKDGEIFESLVYGESIDYVTEAGAGGKLGRLIESSRNNDPVKKLAESVSLSADVTPDQVKDMIKVMENASRDEMEGFISRLALKLGESVSFKESGSPKPNNQGDSMTDEEKRRLSALEESVKTLEADKETLSTQVKEANNRADRAEEANLRAAAATVVRSVLEADDVKDKIPERMRNRIIESQMGAKLPMTDEGKLNKDALKASTEKALEEEIDYIAETSGIGKVRGAGSGRDGGLFNESSSDKNDTEDLQILQKSFEEAGMVEEAAKRAAEGR